MLQSRPLSLFQTWQQHDARALALPLQRKLGETDTDGVLEIPKPLRLPKPALCLGWATTPTQCVGLDWTAQNDAVSLTRRWPINADSTLQVASCHQTSMAQLTVLTLQPAYQHTPMRRYRACVAVATSHMAHWRGCGRLGTGQSIQFVSQLDAQNAAGLALKDCLASPTSRAVAHQSCFDGRVGAAQRTTHCAHEVISPARRVPDEYWPIPLPEREQDGGLNPCGKRPPATHLPLAFVRPKGGHHAHLLPLPFRCRGSGSGGGRQVPFLKGYVMQNDVFVEFDGQKISPLSLNLRTDMDSFCWQIELTLGPDDFVRLAMDGRVKGNEATLSASVNGERFVWLAEDYRDNRVFGQRSYTVIGRSVSAYLGADYAAPNSGVYLNMPLYAQQIAQQQLLPVSFELDWAVEDWLVPADAYSIDGLSPLAVLQDIAQAVGGFVESDPMQKRLAIKPRWPAAAWGIAEAKANMSVPENMIASISGQKRVNTRYDAVYLWAEHEHGKAADVYRTSGSHNQRASALIHALYTDDAVLRQAGLATLSDSGTHKIETVKLPIAPAYFVPRAKLGEIWQFTQSDGAWRGVVTGVAIEVSVGSDGAVEVWQNITVDRYLDE